MRKVLFFITISTIFITGCGDIVSSKKKDNKETYSCDNGGQFCSDENLLSCNNGEWNLLENCADKNMVCLQIDSSSARCKSGDENTENIGAECGNGQIDSGEVCEKNDSKLCRDISSSHTDGTAYCNSSCRGWNMSQCSNSGSKCDNGVLEAGEICETYEKKNCSEIDSSYTTGTAFCYGTCNGWNTSQCGTSSTAECDNGTVESGEVCEQDDYVSCTTLGYENGTAYCNQTCTGWNEDGCGNCASKDHTECYSNQVYWYDSCGNREDLKENCSEKCTAGECVTSNSEPTYVDSDSPRYEWQNNLDPDKLEWDGAINYCENLTYAGFSDWKLPSIDDFKIIIEGCEATVYDCELDNNCNKNSCFDVDICSCSGNGQGEYGHYWEAGVWNYVSNDDEFWTSTPSGDYENLAWMAHFFYATFNTSGRDMPRRVRCVREKW